MMQHQSQKSLRERLNPMFNPLNDSSAKGPSSEARVADRCPNVVPTLLLKTRLNA
jgi:hypothetical protein